MEGFGAAEEDARRFLDTTGPNCGFTTGFTVGTSAELFDGFFRVTSGLGMDFICSSQKASRAVASSKSS